MCWHASDERKHDGKLRHPSDDRKHDEKELTRAVELREPPM
jgi:hypothetical protein